MEPTAATAETARTLLGREPVFHREPEGSDREWLEAMTAPDFVEVGASGTLYDRALVLDVVEVRYRAPKDETWTIDDARCRRLGEHTFLLTYLLDHQGRQTRRSSIWERTADGWRVVYHQGTPVSATDQTR